MSVISDILAGGGTALGNTVSGIIKDFKLDPTVSAQLEEKLKEAIMSHQENMEKMSNDALATVNTTMQVEAKSDHWMQWAWRPLFGFTCAATIINNYIVMPYLPQVKQISIPENVWMVMLTVLGVAAATRGGDKNLLPDINLTRNKP